MNYRCAWVALWALCASLIVRAENGPSDLLEADFSGAAAIRKNTNLVTLREVMALAESAAMADKVLQRSGTAGLSAWTGFAPGDLSLVLREALEYRCRLLVSGPTNAPLFALAVHFSAERPDSWKSGGAAFTNESTQVTEKGSWVVIQSKPGHTNLNAWIDKVVADTNDAQAILTLSANLDHWPAVVRPGLMPGLSALQWSSTVRGDGIRSLATLRFGTNLNLHLTPWNIPTNSIIDPLVAFTAAQDPTAWLNGAELLSRFAWSKPPSQAYLWSVALSPFMCNGAVSAPDAQAQLDATGQALVERYKPAAGIPLLGQVVHDTNLNRVSLTGLPIAVPFLKLAADPGYLTFGLFPLSGHAKQGPAELFNQVIGRTNLVYYDWEITEGRIQQLRTVTQLQSMIGMGGLHSTNAVSEEWLTAISTRLGNSVGELTLSGTNQMSLVRRSPVGIGAMELVGLARWADPFPVVQRKQRRAPAHPVVVPALPAPVQ